jgi:hypothetical protein
MYYNLRLFSTPKIPADFFYLNIKTCQTSKNSDVHQPTSDKTKFKPIVHFIFAGNNSEDLPSFSLYNKYGLIIKVIIQLFNINTAASIEWNMAKLEKPKAR